MADSIRYTLRRILQAADAAGLTPEQRAVFIETLKEKRAPQGRPSREQASREEEPHQPRQMPALSSDQEAWFWNRSPGIQVSIVLLGFQELFRQAIALMGELAKEGRLTDEQIAATAVLARMVDDFFSDWRAKLDFHHALIGPSAGKPLDLAELQAFFEGKGRTLKPESGTPK